MPNAAVKIRIHMSENPVLLERREYRQRLFMKPFGFWYGIGRAWHEWVESEMPHWMGRYNYEVDLGGSNILVLGSPGDLKEFQSQYASPDGSLVNWMKVSKIYDGIEIDPYQWSCRLELPWYYGWDVASGCVWNLASTRIVPVQEKQSQTDENERWTEPNSQRS